MKKVCFSQKSRKQVLKVGENAILTFSLTGSDDKIIFNAIGKIQILNRWHFQPVYLYVFPRLLRLVSLFGCTRSLILPRNFPGSVFLVD